MRNNVTRLIMILSGLLIFLSFIALLINYYIYQYPGNNFFPENTPILALILIFFYTGLVLFFGKDTRASNSGKELLYFFGIMSVIALATNAVQLTPFNPIDKKIMQFESMFHINIIKLMQWTENYPSLKAILKVIYDSFPYQLSIIPLIVIISGRFYLLKDYYFLLLITTLIGFMFYYFFPTTAPASVINSPLFSSEQIATGYKFNQIHRHIIPTTNEGGLIALPSFHTVWSICCLYLLKEWNDPFYILLIINSLLIVSCILLGWHYPVDVIAGLILAGLGIGLLRLIKRENPVRYNSN